MKTTFTLKLLALSALLIVPSRADVSLGGGTGLPLNPTADIAPRGVGVSGLYFDLGDLDLLGETVSSLDYYGVRAFGGVNERLELSLGVDRLDADDPLSLGLNDLSETNALAAVKYQVFNRETNGRSLRVAVGAGYNRALFRNLNAYVVASTRGALGTNDNARDAQPQLHVGVRYDDFSTEDIDGPDDSKLSLFGGVEIPLSRRGDFTLVGEIGTENNELGRERAPYSVSARYRSPQNRSGQFSAQVGIARQGVTGDSGFFARVNYAFGAR